MKIKIINFILLISFTFFAYSCGSIEGSNETGEEFYEYIKNNQFESVTKLFDESVIKNEKAKEIVNTLNEIKKQRGKIESYKKTGFNTNINDENTIITIDYDVTYTNGVYKEQLEMIKSGNDYKISMYSYIIK
jgi:hypothetical protein